MSKTFETCKPLLYSSDITSKNKINSILCDYSQCKITTKINPIIKKHLSNCDTYPFNNKSIITTLYSYENLENINVLQNTETGVTPTTIVISTDTPFFYDYIIDNDKKLSGNHCKSFNYTNYFTKS
jgi:hypothetical protein